MRVIINIVVLTSVIILVIVLRPFITCFFPLIVVSFLRSFRLTCYTLILTIGIRIPFIRSRFFLRRRRLPPPLRL